MIETVEHGAIHEIRLQRPPVNALDPGLLGALVAALEAAPRNGARGVAKAWADPAYRAGVVTALAASFLLTWVNLVGSVTGVDSRGEPPRGSSGFTVA